MKINDFLMFIFDDDSWNNNITRIVSHDENAKTFTCRYVDTDREVKFNYASGIATPWECLDDKGELRTVSIHHVYAPAAWSLFKQGVACVVFLDDRWYLSYVIDVVPDPQLLFYHRGQPELIIEGDLIIASNWKEYPVGTRVKSVQAYANTEG